MFRTMYRRACLINRYQQLIPSCPCCASSTIRQKKEAVRVKGGSRSSRCIPFDFVLLVDHSLGVITNGAGLDEAPDIELFRPEHRHYGVCDV